MPRAPVRRPKARAAKATKAPKAKAPTAAAIRAQRQQAEIYAVVRAIPRGRVATYGQIAELAGIASGHRVVARAMRTCPNGLPWQRVVGKHDARRAKISVQEPEHVRLQQKLLGAEGVGFDAQGLIVLARHGWLPT